MMNYSKATDYDLLLEAAVLTNNYALYNSFIKIPQQVLKLPVSDLREAAKPTEIEKRLVFQFMASYFSALITKDAKSFKTKKLCKGICSYNHLYYRILNNPYKCLWLYNSVLNARQAAELFLPIYEDYLRFTGLTFDQKSFNAQLNPTRMHFRLHNFIKNILQL